MARQAQAVLILCACSMLAETLKAQDSTRNLVPGHYKETILTVGYNYNFGDKTNGVRPEALHFLEVGLWKSTVFPGHHPIIATYYIANDFGLNTDNFVIGPKVGGYFSILVLGFGGELSYYTDFGSGSLRFIPFVGLCTPYFKLTVNPHLIITNKDFQDLNKGHISLTIRVFKIKRTDS